MKSFLAWVFCISQFSVFAQYYIEGQNRFSLKWNQINTEHFQIIFEENNSEQAQRLANTLETIHDAANKSMNAHQKKVSIILQNQTAQSNGFATLAPRRSEFYQMPDQNNYNVEWLNLLCIHEYRHVIQMDKYNQGVTKVISWLFGEQGTGAVLGATTPLWFLEGDAVGLETSLTKGGRGTLPRFEMELKAQFLEQGIHSYDKAIFGSYKQYITNHYKVGYYLTTYAKNEFGLNVWDSTFNRLAKFPFRFFPFSRCLKKETGLTTNDLYEAAYHQLDSLWKEKSVNTTNYEYLNTSKYSYYDALYPTQIDSTKLIYLEKSYDLPMYFMLYDTYTKEKTKLLKVANYNGTRFSYRSGIIAYTCYRPHPRWTYESYNELYTYNIHSRKIEKFNTLNSAFSPTLSNDGKKVAYIEVDKKMNHSIVVLNLETKQELLRLEAPQNHQWIEPYWDKNNIVFIDYYKSKNTLNILDVGTSRIHTIATEFNENIQTPILHNNDIYFSSAQSGTQNIFVYKNGSVQPVTNSKFGAFNPIVNEQNKLLFNDYHSDGYRIVALDKIAQIDDLIDSHSNFSNAMIAAENNENILDSVSNFDYEITRYRKLPHLLNFHSWQPTYLDPDNQEIGIGAGILSQNLLSTAITSVNYQYIPTEERHISSAELSYLGFYPELKTNYTAQWYPLQIGDETIDIQSQSLSFTTDVPLNFYGHKLYKFWLPKLRISTTDYKLNYADKPRYISNGTAEVSSILYISNYSARKDILAPLSFYTYLSFINELYEQKPSRSFTNITRVTLPTFSHHGLQLSYLYQHNSYEGSILSTYNVLPVGYQNRLLQNTQTIGAQYSLPIAYPDLKIGYLAYIQRIRTNIGFEHSWADNHELQSQYLDLIFDSNVFRYAYLMELGLRMVYIPEDDSFSSNFIFGVSF